MVRFVYDYCLQAAGSNFCKRRVVNSVVYRDGAVDASYQCWTQIKINITHASANPGVVYHTLVRFQRSTVRWGKIFRARSIACRADSMLLMTRERVALGSPDNACNRPRRGMNVVVLPAPGGRDPNLSWSRA